MLKIQADRERGATVPGPAGALRAGKAAIGTETPIPEGMFFITGEIGLE
jgi:hypothetical protein